MAKSKFNFKNSSLRWLFSSTFVEYPKIIYGCDSVALLNILHANVRIDMTPSLPGRTRSHFDSHPSPLQTLSTNVMPPNNSFFQLTFQLLPFYMDVTHLCTK